MSEPLTDAEWAEIQEWCAVNPNVRISEEGSILITRDGALQAVVHPRTFLDILKPEPQDADTWPEDNSIVFATIEDCKKAQQLLDDLQAQTTQAVLEEAEWWAAQAGHTGPVHPDMLDEDCAMCYRIVKLRGGRVGSYRDKTMRTFEAGVTDSQTGEPRWTGQMTDAESAAEAEALFEQAGFYRNLIVRDVEYPLHFQRDSRSE